MAINSYRQPLRACFSYAAYSKNLIDYLSSFNIPIEHGLSDGEFSSIESNLNFTFPPDLRSVLQEGLPVGPGVPKWRSASTEQLQILTNLPVINLCKEISRNCFWLKSWGERPKDSDHAVNLGKGFLKNVPVLIPVYWNFYIPVVPCLAGNPLFCVRGGDVSLWSFDIAGFFHRVELKAGEDVLRRPTLSKLLSVLPPWAATAPRRIEFWSDLAETGDAGCRGWWWSGDDFFGGCLEDVFWTLRNAGWKEEEVREMMMMEGGRDPVLRSDCVSGGGGGVSELLDRGFVVRHVEILSRRLLRGGWSPEDVMESMGSSSKEIHDDDGDQEESWFDCEQWICSSNWDDDNNQDEGMAAELMKMMTMNKHRVKV